MPCEFFDWQCLTVIWQARLKGESKKWPVTLTLLHNVALKHGGGFPMKCKDPGVACILARSEMDMVDGEDYLQLLTPGSMGCSACQERLEGGLCPSCLFTMSHWSCCHFSVSPLRCAASVDPLPCSNILQIYKCH